MQVCLNLTLPSPRGPSSPMPFTICPSLPSFSLLLLVFSCLAPQKSELPWYGHPVCLLTAPHLSSPSVSASTVDRLAASGNSHQTDAPNFHPSPSQCISFLGLYCFCLDSNNLTPSTSLVLAASYFLLPCLFTSALTIVVITSVFASASHCFGNSCCSATRHHPGNIPSSIVPPHILARRLFDRR